MKLLQYTCLVVSLVIISTGMHDVAAVPMVVYKVGNQLRLNPGWWNIFLCVRCSVIDGNNWSVHLILYLFKYWCQFHQQWCPLISLRNDMMVRGQVLQLMSRERITEKRNVKRRNHISGNSFCNIDWMQNCYMYIKSVKIPVNVRQIFFFPLTASLELKGIQCCLSLQKATYSSSESSFVTQLNR